MKNRAALLIVLICTVFCYAQRAEEKIFPQQKFDPVAAKQGLAKGTTTLTGKAITQATPGKSKKWALGAATLIGINVTVELYPLTPYFEEWYNLKQKKESWQKRRYVYMDTEAYKYKLTAVTNEKGQFEFHNLKPGKYVLFTIIPWKERVSKRYYNGSQFDGNSGMMVNYYTNDNYTVQQHSRVMRIIEIEEGKSVVKQNLR